MSTFTRRAVVRAAVAGGFGVLADSYKPVTRAGQIAKNATTTVRAASASVRLTDDNITELHAQKKVFSQPWEGEFRANALVLEAQQRICLVSLDALNTVLTMTRSAARRIAAATGIPEDNILKLSVAGAGVAALDAASLQAALESGPCRTLVLGCTAFACGLAFRNPGKVLVLERGILPVPEFAMTYHPLELGEPRTKAGKQLLRDLEKLGIAGGNGILHHPPLTDYFADRLRREGCRVLLNAEVIDINKENGRFRVMVSGVDGLSTFDSDDILDTTPEGWRDCGRDVVSGKAVCATLRGNPIGMPKTEKGVALDKGLFPDEWLLRVDLPAAASWHAARIRLHDGWKGLAERCPELALAGEATELVRFYAAKDIRKTTECGVVWRPSAQYADLMTAFEEGWQCSLA